MFLSKKEGRTGSAAGALTGPVTLPGERLGVWLEGERRGVRVYAPGGYHWAPAPGEEVLVLKAGAQGEQPCALGVPQEEAGLAPGEVLLSTGKAALRLCPDGRVVVTGNLLLNGTRLEPALPEEDEEERGVS